MSDVLLVCADARHIPLPDNSVQCVVTSPPYWGLRKYAGEQESVWEPVVLALGDALLCEGRGHIWADETQRVEIRQGKGLEELSKRYRGGGHSQQALAEPFTIHRGTCQQCGAWRGAFGLEPTVEMYVAHTVEILREIRRVLRKDGVCFWNLGDSYSSFRDSKVSPDSLRDGDGTAVPCGASNRNPTALRASGLKHKDLVLMPARVALAAQSDGWWVRSDIIWAKPNPMPESVTDRPTDAYEHILMLTKSARYYWDADAVREPKAESTITDHRTNDNGHRRDRAYPGAPSNGGTNLGGPDGGRNLRNVWTFATQPYKGSHYATFPEELPRRCILAASKPGDLVLDPFGGSGTTGEVAIQLNRNAVLLDLAYTHSYGELAKERTTEVQRELML